MAAPPPRARVCALVRPRAGWERPGRPPSHSSIRPRPRTKSGATRNGRLSRPSPPALPGGHTDSPSPAKSAASRRHKPEKGPWPSPPGARHAQTLRMALGLLLPVRDLAGARWLSGCRGRLGPRVRCNTIFGPAYVKEPAESVARTIARRPWHKSPAGPGRQVGPRSRRPGQVTRRRRQSKPLRLGIRPGGLKFRHWSATGRRWPARQNDGNSPGRESPNGRRGAVSRETGARLGESSNLTYRLGLLSSMTAHWKVACRSSTRGGGLWARPSPGAGPDLRPRSPRSEGFTAPRPRRRARPAALRLGRVIRSLRLPGRVAVAIRTASHGRPAWARRVDHSAAMNQANDGVFRMPGHALHCAPRSGGPPPASGSGDPRRSRAGRVAPPATIPRGPLSGWEPSVDAVV